MTYPEAIAKVQAVIDTLQSDPNLNSPYNQTQSGSFFICMLNEVLSSIDPSFPLIAGLGPDFPVPPPLAGAPPLPSVPKVVKPALPFDTGRLRLW